MGRKYIGVLIITAAVFGMAGLITGEYVSLPEFKASGESGGGSSYNTTHGLLNVQSEKVTKTSLAPIYTKNQKPYTCPKNADWTQVISPFYLIPKYPDALIQPEKVKT